jgi:putative salt-induced outer membrane protein YdiY
MSKLAIALRALPLVGVLVAPVVHAQATPPAGASERPALVAPSNPKQITANVSAGGTLNGGNTRSFGATVGGRFQLIEKPHQLTLEALGTYTAAAVPPNDKVHTTARNLIGRARYDIYLSDNNALFAALAPRHDRYAGIDLRLQSQVGYLRNLYHPADNHRLWLEVGYDGTYDNLTPWLPPGKERAPGDPRPKAHEFIHSGRLFAGYTNLLTPLATLNLGVEFLYDFQKAKNVRVNPTLELTSSLSARFKLSLLSRILFDNDPVEGKKKTDYVTTAQLVFTYDSITPPPACPACDCSDEVAAAKSACKQTTSPADLPPSAYIPQEEPAPAAPIAPQPAPAQPAPAKPAP